MMASNKLTLFFILISGVSAGIPAPAQTFDTSGNGKLTGPYFVRQVVTTDLDANTNAIDRAISLTGVMTFDGHANYTFAGQEFDTMAGSSAVAYDTSGSYSVESNGMAQLSNPIDSTDIEYGAVTGVGPQSIVASATEGSYNDLFVAIQAGTGASVNTVSGLYNVGFIDFLQANASQVRDGYYTINSSGVGSLGTVSVTGAMANQGSNSITVSYPSVTCAITSPNGSGPLTFPTSSSPLSALVSGQKTLYVSEDGTLAGWRPEWFRPYFWGGSDLRCGGRQYV
jgi:hypothetical protein